MKILITGGAGFIGSNLAAFYLKQNHEVTIFDNLSRANVAENVTWLTSINQGKLEVITKDIRNQDDISQAVVGKDVVFHEAAQTAVTTSHTDPRNDFEENALGTFNVLEAVRQKSPEAIVFYASTNKVYGDLVGREAVPVSEAQPLDFYSPYGCSKGTADQYVRDYHRSFGLRTVVFRQSCIYGEHQFGVEDQGWVAHFAARAIKKEPITIFGDGTQVRDLLFINDLVEGYDKALQAITKTNGQIFNMGGGASNTASLFEVIDELEQLSHEKINLSFEAVRLGDQKYYVSDCTKAKQVFDWEPRTDVKTGITRLYTWLSEFISHQTI